MWEAGRNGRCLFVKIYKIFDEEGKIEKND